MAEEEQWQYVHQKKEGFWRRRPYHYDHPTKAQREMRNRLAEAAGETKGMKGTEVIINKKGETKEVSKAAAHIARKLTGKRVTTRPKSRRRKAPTPFLEALEPFAKQIAEITGSAKTFNQIICAMYKKPTRHPGPRQRAEHT